MCPDSEKNLLGNFLGIGMAAEHAARQSKHTREMPVDKQPAGRLITQRHTRYQFIV